MLYMERWYVNAEQIDEYAKRISSSRNSEQKTKGACEEGIYNNAARSRRSGRERSESKGGG